MKDQLKQAIIDGNADTVNALTQALLATGASAREILEEALLPGMDVVGQRMRDGEWEYPGGIEEPDLSGYDRFITGTDDGGEER